MRPLACALFAASFVLAPSVAEARQSIDLPYPIEQSWNAAVRLVRVDMGFAITERDRESGFLLFTYRDTTRSSAASIELIPADVGGVVGVRVVVQIPAMPTYMERHLLTRLDRKLHDDYGEPRKAAAERARARSLTRARARPGTALARATTKDAKSRGPRAKARALRPTPTRATRGAKSSPSAERDGPRRAV
jgi:hypothetical protein